MRAQQRRGSHTRRRAGAAHTKAAVTVGRRCLTSRATARSRPPTTGPSAHAHGRIKAAFLTRCRTHTHRQRCCPSWRPPGWRSRRTGSRRTQRLSTLLPRSRLQAHRHHGHATQHRDPSRLHASVRVLAEATQRNPCAQSAHPCAQSAHPCAQPATLCAVSPPAWSQPCRRNQTAGGQGGAAQPSSDSLPAVLFPATTPVTSIVTFVVSDSSATERYRPPPAPAAMNTSTCATRAGGGAVGGRARTPRAVHTRRQPPTGSVVDDGHTRKLDADVGRADGELAHGHVHATP